MYDHFSYWKDTADFYLDLAAKAHDAGDCEAQLENCKAAENALDQADLHAIAPEPDHDVNP